MPRSEIRRERGTRIDAALKKAGLSYTFIAEQMGCSRQLVGSWCAGGNISADQLGRLCLLARCSTDSIIYGTADEDLATDPIAQQFERLEPVLRQRMWTLYQVFIRPGAAERAQEPS